MIVQLKKGLKGKRRGRNIPFLSRFKPKRVETNKRKRVEIRLTDDVDQKARHILQQVSIRRGKKSKSIKLINELVIFFKKKFRGKNANSLLNTVLNRSKVMLYFRPKKVGSMTYRVPVNLFPKKGLAVAARWLMAYNRSNPSRASIKNIIEEVNQVQRDRGTLLKKRAVVHKLGIANMPYLKYLKRDKRK